MQFGIDDKSITKIKAVFYRYPQIEQVIVYGSRAKGTYKNGSDIDLALIGQNLDLVLIGKLQGDLDDLMLPYTFDISVLEKITNPELIDNIKRDGAVFKVHTVARGDAESAEFKNNSS